MDYQSIYANQIKNLDYWSLVQMLLTPITPEMRKCILDKLTEMNNQLLLNNSIFSGMQLNLMNSENLNKTKDSLKPLRSGDFSRLNNGPSMNQYNPLRTEQNSHSNGMKLEHPQKMEQSDHSNGVVSDHDINLDDEFEDEKSNENRSSYIDNISLDLKLAKIKTLYDKVIADKRKRRKEKEFKL